MQRWAGYDHPPSVVAGDASIRFISRQPGMYHIPIPFDPAFTYSFPQGPQIHTSQIACFHQQSAVVGHRPSHSRPSPGTYQLYGSHTTRSIRLGQHSTCLCSPPAMPEYSQGRSISSSSMLFLVAALVCASAIVQTRSRCTRRRRADTLIERYYRKDIEDKAWLTAAVRM